MLLRLTDTAGIRKTGDAVERLGVERSLKAARAHGWPWRYSMARGRLTKGTRMCSQAAKRAVNALAVINKCDMPQIADIKRIEGALGRVCLVSAKEGIGLDSIRRAVEEIFGENIPKPDGSVLTNLRQHTAAKNALSALDNALNALSAGQTPDAVLSDASRLWRLWAR